MKEIIILASTIAVFFCGYSGIKELTKFIKENRRGRKNYELFFNDDED